MQKPSGTLIAAVIGGAALIGALVYMLVTDSQEEAKRSAKRRAAQKAAMRTIDVDELMREPERRLAQEIKVHGWVTHGTIRGSIEQDETVRVFELNAKQQRVMVRITGAVPDAFRDGAEVVVTGTLTKAGASYRLDAKELMAKCPTNYDRGAGPMPAKFQ